MIVCKFGGTSVATSYGANKIKEIVDSNSNRKIVVVSAIGKSDKNPVKITDLLIKLYVAVKSKKVEEGLIDEIFDRYRDLSLCLNVHIDWDGYRNDLINYINIEKISKDYIISRGEYYSAILYSKYLGWEFIDAKNCIKFNKNKTVNYKKTKALLQKIYKKYENFVIGGFYGSDSKGNIITFDRGGSDITGAIIAKLLNAEVYENYTDVDGVFDRNPNIFEKAKKLPLLNYKTAIQMADAGNEIVHKTALAELKNSNTLLIVKSTYCYNNLGTVVVDNNVMLNQLFMCLEKCWVLVTSKLDEMDKKYLASKAQLHKIIHKDGGYYIILKTLYDDLDNYKEITGFKNIEESYVLTIFSNAKISKEKIKLIEKKTKKIKKHIILADFITFYNNFLIIFKCDKLENVKQNFILY